ncbi:MAG: hypothetical protein ABII64_01895 [Elusimicrobiota bacterium]
MKVRNKIKNAAIIGIVFVAVVFVHVFYLVNAKDSCVEDLTRYQSYVNQQDYFITLSYALSLAFMAYSFLKYKENKKKSMAAATGGGMISLGLWLLCFLSGCCGSPMLIVYMNLFGISALHIPKGLIFLITVIFVALCALWLNRRVAGTCCEGSDCDSI